MKNKKIPTSIEKALKTIKNKRARIVIEHIMEHGFITTEDLEKTYGYNHPPRAARDVRESGIPLETYRVKSTDGRSIAAYKFGDLTKIIKGRLEGRKTLSKKLKNALYEKHGGQCQICGSKLAARYLQIDHRIPYEIAGESKATEEPETVYMLVCGSCNRAKSWSCEHCPNWIKGKSHEICSGCYWAFPKDYSHIALHDIRRMEIVWQGDEVELYENLKEIAENRNIEAPDYVKKIISEHVLKNK